MCFCLSFSRSLSLSLSSFPVYLFVCECVKYELRENRQSNEIVKYKIHVNTLRIQLN